MSGAILVTGASGRSGPSVIEALTSKYPNFTVVAASRSGKDVGPKAKGVKFDWLDSTTFENPFTTNPNIDRVYIISPPVGMENTLAATQPFLEFCKSKGVKRFVLLSSTAIQQGDPYLGQIHQWLAEQPNIEYAIMRPSWFMQNFTVEWLFEFIQKQDQIVTAAGDAKASWVDAKDIGEAAAQALTEEPCKNGEYIILGPELLSYEEMAKILSEVLDRNIGVVKAELPDYLERLQKDLGYPEPYAQEMGLIDHDVLGGGLEQSKTAGGSGEKWIGKISFRDFVVANKSVWSK